MCPQKPVKLSPLSLDQGDDDAENDDVIEEDIGEDKCGVIACHPRHRKDTDLLKFDRFRYRSWRTGKYFSKSFIIYLTEKVNFEEFSTNFLLLFGEINVPKSL